jgi:hypothetical protein
MLLASDVDTGTARLTAPVGFDQGLFDSAVKWLGRQLGKDNPDVVALSTKTSEPPDPLPQIDAPPMLWRSWLLLLDACTESRDLIPLQVSRQVSKRLPMRPLLVWSPVTEEAADEWQLELGEIAKRAGSAEELSKQLLVPQAAIDAAVETDS